MLHDLISFLSFFLLLLSSLFFPSDATGDMVTAVEFDQTGDYLAVGDKAGRIWLFEGHVNKVLAD
jgi:hypothetical protein